MSLLFVDQDILILHLKQLSSFWGVLYIYHSLCLRHSSTICRTYGAGGDQEKSMLFKQIYKTI